MIRRLLCWLLGCRSALAWRPCAECTEAGVVTVEHRRCVRCGEVLATMTRFEAMAGLASER